MRKLLFILFALIFIPSFSFAAINAGTAWEIRTTGSQNNGGGFVILIANTSTDYSQQDAAEDSGTDLVSGDGDAVPCIVISATHNFVNADTGNIIHITEAGTGFTLGWYQIVSTDTNAATLDRACGANGELTGGDWYLGGAFLIGGTLDHEFFERPVAGNTIWIQNGTYTLGEAHAGVVVGTSTNPITVQGYNGTRAGTPNPTGANRPSIAVGANAFNFGAYWNFKNFILTTSNTEGFYGGTGAIFQNLKVTQGAGSGAAFSINGNYTKMIGCEMIASGGTGISSGGSLTAIGNYIHGCATCILNFSNSIYTNNILAGCTTTGISLGTTVKTEIYGNTIYGAETPAGTGILGTTASAILVMNNVIYGFTDPIKWTALYNSNFADYNDLYNNSNARTNFPTGVHDIALNPTFIDAAGGDFRVGVNMKAVGFTGSFAPMGAAATCIDYKDIGAVQRIEPSGGGAWVY